MAAREAHTLQLSPADRLLSLMPLFHLHGLAAVLTQLFSGGTAIAIPGYHPATFLPWLQQFQPTWFSSHAPLNRAILALARAHPEVFRSSPLRVIRITGATPEAAIPAALEEAVGVPVLAGYGLTETGGVTRNTEAARKPGSVGRSSGLEVAIMDEAGNLLPAEAEGEVVVRGPSVTSGYLDDPEANLAAFRGGWFHTGDIGRLDGEKIVPQDVECALLAHAAVAEAAVFAVYHRTLGEDVAAAVVLRPGAAASELKLRRFAAGRLAPFKVPRRIVFLDGIPRTATGKPQRAQLAERYRGGIPWPDR
jgi:acyl-CoA synthetase (AMP-forming)/AMP-acid ligase II